MSAETFSGNAAIMEYMRLVQAHGVERVEFLPSNDYRWNPATCFTGNADGYQFRLKSNFLTVQIPMPEKVAPADGTKVWLATALAISTVWNGAPWQSACLQTGLVYLTESDAQLAIDARAALVRA